MPPFKRVFNLLKHSTCINFATHAYFQEDITYIVRSDKLKPALPYSEAVFLDGFRDMRAVRSLTTQINY